MGYTSQGFGAFQLVRKQHKMPHNPLDKCTIVSLYPREIRETKISLEPGFFHIPAAPVGEFSLLVVGPASWWKEMDEQQPYVEIPSSSITVAESVIRDFCNGLFCSNMGDSMPGLFYLPGSYNNKNILAYKNAENNLTFKDYFDIATKKQNNYFQNLVNAADIMWTRTQGNPIAISDEAKQACEILKLNKPWMKDHVSRTLDSCPACGELTNLRFPVCKHCRAIIDPEKAKEMGLKFAS